MNPAEYTLRNAVIAWVVTVLVLIGGYLSYERLGRFEDPEFVIRQAVVVTAYPGASPAQVAEEVTDLIEGAVQQMQEVEEVISVSRAGESLVKVEAKLAFSHSQAELDQVWDKLRSKISSVSRSLPPGAAQPVVNGDFGDVFALFYAVTGDGYTPRQLYDYADFLRRELVLVPGVAKVALLGERPEAIFVEISRARAAQLGVPLEKVHATLRAQNVINPAGNVLAGDLRLQINPDATVESVDALKNLVVAGDSSSGLVRLLDIADIRREYLTPPAALVRHEGQPAIGLGVSNVLGGNVVEMGDAVKRRLAGLENQRPVGMELSAISIQSDSVRAAVDGFVANLVAAVAIVVVVLLFFMGVRSGLIIGAILVLTVAGTLIAMLLDGIAMQRISLGALIIALGMLVDNAIVVTDGILVRMQRGEAARPAATAVVKATVWPLLGGTVVGILAFSAIGLSPTDMGEYAGSLFWVILYSMMLSWLFAITLTPLFCVALLKVTDQPVPVRDGRVMTAYRRLLRTALAYRRTSGALLVALLAAGVVAFGFVPPGFMPDSARPQFVVDLYLPQGTDIDATARVVAEVERKVKARPGVSRVTSFIGRGGLRFMLTYSPEDPNPAYGQVLVDVERFEDIAGLIAALQPELGQAFPHVDVKVWKFMLGRGGGKKIEAAFRGPDPQVLRGLADEAKAVMAKDPEALAIQDDWRQQVPVVAPRFSVEAAQRAGVLPSDIAGALEHNYVGQQIGVYREREKLIPIVARAPAAEREGVEDLRSVQVFSPTAGRFVPVEQFIEGTETRWENAIIRRENRFPMIKAQCDPPAGQLSAPLFERLRPQIEAIALPPGYALEWHGEHKASTEANEGLATAAPYGFVAMVLAVIVMFNAFRQTAVIWLTVPLAVLGVAVGLLLFQAPFEFMAILGFLSLTGMLIKNAIVLVDQIDTEIRDGKPRHQAVLDASASRARPVFLGAATTVLGVAPLLVDPFFRSMAVTIMFGLIFATLLTLVVVPLLYAAFFGIHADEGGHEA
ncbi:efflux RND transporter permease subunit [Methyloversatilis sp. XJ19-49]|uniref:efflux RND transporter permease subunit n=1 Tax=Methyloversatilis sp. XJ19-49 TaxID=2963429 RepID=UPI00211C909D|nr:efflux RND transporter permease subunit [Methyloversatilis sp. XJ19-49]MCQ9379692.1 efflux RND transporter permease subunit [Methyloversatilis sp. XJ19-49]